MIAYLFFEIRLLKPKHSCKSLFSIFFLHQSAMTNRDCQKHMCNPSMPRIQIPPKKQTKKTELSKTRLEIFSSISATKSVPVSPVLFFEILRGHIASPPRAKIGQALSPCERELVLINNVLTSEIKSFLSVPCMPCLRIF